MSRSRRSKRRAGMTGRQLAILALLALLLLAVVALILIAVLGTLRGPTAPPGDEPAATAVSTLQKAVSVTQAIEPTSRPLPATGGPTATGSVPAASVASSTAAPPTIPPPEPTPTVTATVTTTPAVDACSQLSLSYLGSVSNVVQWRLQSLTGGAIELTRAQIGWPQENEGIFNVMLDGKAIWSSQDFSPPTAINSWFGTVSDRMVSGTVRLELFFGMSAADSGYSVLLWFGNGCQIAASG